jgi:hypothetical protein
MHAILHSAHVTCARYLLRAQLLTR